MGVLFDFSSSMPNSMMGSLSSFSPAISLMKYAKAFLLNTLLGQGGKVSANLGILAK